MTGPSDPRAETRDRQTQASAVSDVDRAPTAVADETVLGTLISTFDLATGARILGHLRDDLVRVRRALSLADAPSAMLERQAHVLVSLSGLAGEAALCAAARDLQAASLTGNVAATQSLLPGIIRRTDALIDAVAAQAAGLAPDGPKAPAGASRT